MPKSTFTYQGTLILISKLKRSFAPLVCLSLKRASQLLSIRRHQKTSRKLLYKKDNADLLKELGKKRFVFHWQRMKCQGNKTIRVNNFYE